MATFDLFDLTGALTPEQIGFAIRRNGAAQKLSSSQRVWSSQPFPTEVNNVTIVNQIPVPEGVNGFRLIYENGVGAATSVYTARYATTDAEGSDGSALSWSGATFDGSASAALPVPSGSAPQSVITPVISDRVDIPLSDYLYVRSYFTGRGAALNPDAGALEAFSAATGDSYKSGFAIGAVGDSSALPVSYGQLIVPSGVVWYRDSRSVTVAAFGGSTLRGQGSTADTYGIVYRACENLDSPALRFTPYVAAQSGQNSTTSTLQLEKTAESIKPDIALILGGSGNDADLSEDGFLSMRSRVSQQVETCVLNGIKPVVCTLMPSVTLTPSQDALRVSQNDWIKSLGVSFIDFSGVAEDPSDPSQILPAYDSGDGVHLSDAGQAAVAQASSVIINQLVG